MFSYMMTICYFGCFSLRFRGRFFGSDCGSSWLLLTFLLCSTINWFKEQKQFHPAGDVLCILVEPGKVVT